MSNDPKKVEGAQRPAPKQRPAQDFKDVLKTQPQKKPTVAATSKPVAVVAGAAAGSASAGAATAASAAGFLKRPGQGQAKALPLCLSGSPSLIKGGLGTQVAALKVVEQLGVARTSMHADASLLSSIRGEGQAAQEQKVEGRLVDLVVKELTAELAGAAELPRGQVQSETAKSKQDAPTPPGKSIEGAAGVQSQSQPSQATPASAALKAQAAVALVEKIEAFVRSQRPGIALSVGGGLDARVEVERTGKGEVALTVKGRRGPPAAEELSRIREALTERGLKLSRLSVG